MLLVRQGLRHIWRSCSGRSHCLRYSSSLASDRYDAVIVGGGMIGSAAAVVLGLEDKLETKKILILDQSTVRPSYQPNSEYNLRVINLTVGNCEFLDKIGAWDKIRAMRYHSYDQIICWERHSNQTISFEENPMGFIIENNVLELALLEIAENLHNVEVLKGVKVNEVSFPTDGSSITLNVNDAQEIKADLVLGADGSNSFVRKAMDVPKISWPYDQRATVCVLQSDSTSFDHIAFQRFLGTGPIALLPLGKGLFSLIWSCKTNVAKELDALNDEEFVDRVNNALQRPSSISSAVAAIENIFQQVGFKDEPPATPTLTKLIGKRASYPLGFMASSRIVAPRTVIIGDAAQRVHPLAGQGANIGFRDVQRLCAEIRNSTADLGDVSVLNSYETKTQRFNGPMLGFLDGMNKLYSNSFEPLVFTRNIGLHIVNQFDFMKKMFVSNARS